MAKETIYVARELLESGEDFVVATVVSTEGSTPRKKGAWLLMKRDGTTVGTVGGGKLEAETERIARETFHTKKTQIFHFALKPEEQQGIDMRCGGDADIQIQYVDAKHPETFKEEFDPEATAYIFGGGHVAKALEPVLRYVNFKTVIIDDRAEFANWERFPKADDVKVISSFENAYEGIDSHDNDFIVIVTRGHSGDYDVLKQTLKRKNAYIGMIGSKGKVKDTFNRLLEEGFTQTDIDKIYSPIGLSISSETPEEIAISIVGEMIKVRAEHGK